MLEACHRLYFKKHKELAKEKLLEQIGQARILHQDDFIKLMQENKTINPYELLGVTDGMQEMWERD